MEQMLLRDREIVPTVEVLKVTLGKVFTVFETLRERITGDGLALSLEWNYYRDGRAWLCKVCSKKKTVFWLSVWEGYFQTSFYFTEKHLEGIAKLDIDEDILTRFLTEKPVGKLLPMIFRIRSENQLPDLMKVVEFKKNLK